MSRLRVNYAPGEVSIDAVYGEAWLLSELGDSAAAAKRLDFAFSGISTSLPAVLGDEVQAACFVRAMLLRAKLAAKSDPTTASKWLLAATQLWGSGEPPALQELQKVRRIVATVSQNP